MKIFIFVFIGMILFSISACSKQEDLVQMSPKEIVNLYYKSRNDGDTETLKQIIYFTPDTTEEQKQNKVQSVLAGSDEKLLMRSAGVNEKVEYERIIEEDIAEVGLILGGIAGMKGRVPVGQIILKRENGIWKYYYNKYELSENELTNMIKKNPNDPSLYYLLGNWIVNENPARAYRYFKKYYELEPDGFWISDSFLQDLKDLGNLKIFENKLLANLDNVPQYSPDRALTYRYIGQMYMERGNYEKAKQYFNKVEEILKVDKDPKEIENLQKAKTELQLRTEGKYVDLLDELEQRSKEEN